MHTQYQSSLLIGKENLSRVLSFKSYKRKIIDIQASRGFSDPGDVIQKGC